MTRGSRKQKKGKEHGGPIHAIPLGSIKGDQENALTCQVAISPDDRTLAISTALCYDKEMRRDDRALYVIDLRGSIRKVRRLAVPWTP